MTALAISSPLPQFFDLAGAALAGGKIYFGLPYQNPEVSPISVYWDAAATQPAAQPVRTLGGYPARNGTPAGVFIAGDYSVTVKTAAGGLVYYAPSAADVNPGFRLLTDLGSVTGSTKGAGAVAYGPTVEYPAYTVGGELRTIQSCAAHFWAKARANQADLKILVLSDSTGNEITEWPYRMLDEWMRQELPTHTFKYSLYGLGQTVANGGNETWGAYVTLQAGSGSKTVFMDNAAIAGVNTNYFEGGRKNSIYRSKDYDLVIINCGHNSGTDTTEEIIQPEFMTAVCQARKLAPRAGILVTLQNPRTDAGGPEQTARMVNAWRNVASQLDVGVIDIYSTYKALSNPGDYMSDTVHPNFAGQTLWVSVLMRTLCEPLNYMGEDPGSYSPLTIVRPNYLQNPRFSSWSGAVPDNWSASNCTVAKDPGRQEDGIYSMRVTATGLNPQITQDFSGQLPRLRGSFITLVARIWRSAGMDSLAGRVGLTTDTVGGSVTSYPRSLDSAGGFEEVSIALAVPLEATTLSCVLYTGAANGSDTGKQIWIDHIAVFEGSQPGDVSKDDLWRKVVLDYYSDGSVGKVAGNTGTLTAVGGVVTLTGANPAFSDIFINLPVPPGKPIKVSFRPFSASGGIAAGGVLIRYGQDGGGSNVVVPPGTGDWVGGGALVSFVITPPTSGPICLRPYGYTGVTDFVLDQWSIKPVESGIARAINLPINSARNSDGTALAATASAGKFGLDTGIAGAVTRLSSESATAATKTSTATWEFALPNDYVAGRDLTVTVNANFGGTGSALTKSLTMSASSIADSAGTQTALTVSSAATLTNAAADYVFTITGTNLSPGQRVLLQAVIVLQENGGVNPLTARLNSVRIS